MKLSERVRSTHNQDGAVVLDILHGQIVRLNLVGSRMLELLKQGYSDPQIVDAISRDTGAPREIVESDFQEFLTHLEKHHLLEVGQPEPHSAL